MATTSLKGIEMHFSNSIKGLVTGLTLLAFTATSVMADAAASAGASSGSVAGSTSINEGDSGNTFGGGAVGAAECAEAFIILGIGGSSTNQVCLLVKSTLSLYQAGLLTKPEARLNALYAMELQGIKYAPKYPAANRASTRSPAPAVVAAPAAFTPVRMQSQFGAFTITTPEQMAAFQDCARGVTVNKPDGSPIRISSPTCQ